VNLSLVVVERGAGSGEEGGGWPEMKSRRQLPTATSGKSIAIKFSSPSLLFCYSPLFLVRKTSGRSHPYFLASKVIAECYTKVCKSKCKCKCKKQG